MVSSRSAKKTSSSITKPTTQFRVWWIPQIPTKAFEYPVDSLKEAVILLDVLAKYDMFQFENKVKPDYSNMGGVQVWSEEEKEYVDWCDEETGENIDDILHENNGVLPDKYLK